jgi:hypothetical protein
LAISQPNVKNHDVLLIQNHVREHLQRVRHADRVSNQLHTFQAKGAFPYRRIPRRIVKAVAGGG